MEQQRPCTVCGEPTDFALSYDMDLPTIPACNGPCTAEVQIYFMAPPDIGEALTRGWARRRKERKGTS